MINLFKIKFIFENKNYAELKYEKCAKHIFEQEVIENLILSRILNDWVEIFLNDSYLKNTIVI